MGSPETCEKCGGVGRHVEGKRGFTRFPCPNATPTPPGAAPDAASGPKAPPRMPAPADARPMVVGGAFVKFDLPAPAHRDVVTTWDADHAALSVKFAGPDVPVDRTVSVREDPMVNVDYAADGSVHSVEVLMPPAPAPDAGAAEDHPSEAKRDHGAEGSDRAVVEAMRELFDLFVDVLAQGTARAASDHATGRCVITYDDGCTSSYEDAFTYLGLTETPSKRWFTSDEFYAAVKAKGAALRGTKGGERG